MKRYWMRVLLFGLAVLSASALASQPAAAEYPDRTITIIVPYSPGTGQDLLARIIGEELQKAWGHPVVIDNKTGANGTLGTQQVARATPDGYTLLMTSTSFTTNLSLLKNIPYDPIKNFAPIIQPAIGNLALAVHSSVPVKTAQEFVSYVKERPDQMNYSSPGTGGPHHLAMELFKQMTGVKLQHIPYKGTAGAVADLIGGHVSAGFVTLNFVIPMLSAGQIRLLGVGGLERASVLPDLPTLNEQGITGFNVTVWFGFFAPGGTPPDIVAKLNTQVNQILKMPHVADALDKNGVTAVGGPPDRLGSLVAREIDVWRNVVKNAGIVAE